MWEPDPPLQVRVERLAALLVGHGLQLGVAESCTGGLLAGLLTALPGSSAWFRGAVVAYHNAVKERVLAVPPEVLEAHGAVSLDTVRAMALGVCGCLEAEVGVAISGVAGPTGGTPEKPVGTVCIAVSLQGLVSAESFLFSGDRAGVRWQSVLMALELLLQRLELGTRQEE